MTDFFKLLQIPRIPSPDLDALKQQFHDQSSNVHPDRFHQASPEEQQSAHSAYTLLNEAYQSLKEPKDRLLHLIKLETGDEPAEVVSIPHETTDLFMEVGSLCRQVDEFFREGEAIESPMLKVAWFEKCQEWENKLSATKAKLDDWCESLDQELARLNETWEEAKDLTLKERAAHLPLDHLEKLYRLFSYAIRWTSQIQERQFRLSATALS